MRERELENWGHLKSGDCHQKFLTQSKAYSFFMFFIILKDISVQFIKMLYLCISHDVTILIVSVPF